jgi:hypothetical protein
MKLFRKYIRNLFLGKKLIWDLSQSPQQVADRLKQRNEDTPGRTDHRVRVKVRDDKFSLSSVNGGKPTGTRNGFAHLVDGQIISTSEGSRVVAQFRLHLYVFAFSMVWLTGAFLIAVGGGLVCFYQAFAVHPVFAVLGLFMMGFFVLMVSVLNLFKKASVKEEQRIENILISVLGQAKEVS